MHRHLVGQQLRLKAGESVAWHDVADTRMLLRVVCCPVAALVSANTVRGHSSTEESEFQVKINLRPATWAIALAVAITVFSTPKLNAAYQSQEDRGYGQGRDNGADRDGDRDDNVYANSRDYQRGLNHGREDGANRRAHQYRVHPDNDADRRAYERGYDYGYQANYRRDATNSDNYPRDAYGQNRNPGYQMGFRDGSNDGHNDRAKGRKMKYGLGYKHPDRGYNSSYGNKEAYKQQYRQAYEQAYQQSYNGQGDDHRGWGHNR